MATGSYGSAVIILQTDGQTTAGPDPMTAAQMAADRGVKVVTVGFGTKDGEVIGFEGASKRRQAVTEKRDQGKLSSANLGSLPLRDFCATLCCACQRFCAFCGVRAPLSR